MASCNYKAATSMKLFFFIITFILREGLHFRTIKTNNLQYYILTNSALLTADLIPLCVKPKESINCTPK
jgi:hypothetical protein